MKKYIHFYQSQSLFSSYINLDTGEIHRGWGVYLNLIKAGSVCLRHSGHSGKTESYCYDYVFSENNNRLTLSATGLTTVTLIKI